MVHLICDIRTDSYVMLGSLLGHPPSESLLNILQNLSWDDGLPESIEGALQVLHQASFDYTLQTLQHEFNRLFVGLGSGEVVPYASWYREKKIQSYALAALRSDLVRLGIVRQQESYESEDHAGSLCEIMALITLKREGASRARQAIFFQKHVSSWMTTFFNDLRSAKDAQFYRIVGIFGSQFLKYEMEYLKHDSNI